MIMMIMPVNIVRKPPKLVLYDVFPLKLSYIGWPNASIEDSSSFGFR